MCLIREGTAEKLLTEREEQRGRRITTDFDGEMPDTRRQRSISSHSMSSVSTISTNRSPSASPVRRRASHRSAKGSRKRRYSSSSGNSVASYSSTERRTSSARARKQDQDRNTRRRHRESSPEQRGRRRSLSGDSSRREGPPYGRDRVRSPGAPRQRSTDQAEDNSNGDYGMSFQRRHRGSLGHDRNGEPPAARKERSLSPYSKRLALTQAMNSRR